MIESFTVIILIEMNNYFDNNSIFTHVSPCLSYLSFLIKIYIKLVRVKRNINFARDIPRTCNSKVAFIGIVLSAGYFYQLLYLRIF